MSGIMRQMPPLDSLILGALLAASLVVVVLSACTRRERPATDRLELRRGEAERPHERSSKYPPKHPRRPKLVDYLA